MFASGPLACVAAAEIHGRCGRQIGMPETTRRLLDDLWQFEVEVARIAEAIRTQAVFLGFVANAIVFVLVGFTANLAILAAHAWPATVARFVLLGALSLPRRKGSLATSPAERAVLAWSGLRGALSRRTCGRSQPARFG